MVKTGELRKPMGAGKLQKLVVKPVTVVNSSAPSAVHEELAAKR